MKYLNKKIIFNDKEYLVIDEIVYENKSYVYVVNKFNEEDSKFIEINENCINEIDKDLFNNTLFPMFIEKIST